MKIKNLVLHLLFLSVFVLFFMPGLCRADMAMPYFFNLPLLAVTAVLGVWMIETIYLATRLGDSPRRAFMIAFFVNLVTASIGAIVAILGIYFSSVENLLGNVNDAWLGPFESLFDSFFSLLPFKFSDFFAIIFVFIWILLLPFAITFIVEGILLRFCYPKNKWTSMVWKSFVMNFMSYVILFVLFIATIVPFCGIFIVPLIFGFFLHGLFFRILDVGNSPKYKARIKLLICILVIAVFAVSFVTISGISLDSRPRLSRDSRIRSAIAQARTVMVNFYVENGSFAGLSCNNAYMKVLCNDVHKNSWKEIGLIIVVSQDGKNACMYAPLRAKDGKTAYCADSSGAAGSASTEAIKESCNITSSVSCPPGLSE